MTETGVAGTVGAFAFASVNNPTQITAIMVGGGLQGTMFAVRYASMSVAAQFNGARANAADQFVYSIKTPGGTTLAAGTTTGAGTGPFPAASVSTIAAGYPFVVTEAQAPGSVSPLADYAVSLTCTNQTTGSSTTVLPNNQVTTSYTFPGLQYGDAISCVFTDTANRTNLTIAKSGPANVNAGAALAYTLVVGNAGPLSAAGALVQDPAVANFSATGIVCSGATGGAACPAIAQLTIANLQGVGIAIPTLPPGGDRHLGRERHRGHRQHHQHSRDHRTIGGHQQQPHADIDRDDHGHRGGGPRDHAQLPRERERGTAGLGHGAVQ